MSKTKSKPNRQSITKTVMHAAYEACLEAGLLRNGRAVRSGQRFQDRKKEQNRLACRGKQA